MNRNFTHVFIAFFLSFPFSLAYTQTTYIDNGSSSTYTLKTGDSLYISQGTFTGKINDEAQGGKVTIAAAATFKPSSVKGYRSKYMVYGTAILPSLQTEAGFGLENYGVITINGNTQMNSGAQTWVNAKHASIYIKGFFQISATGSTFTNYGELVVEKDFNSYAAASVINRSNFLIGKSIELGTGQFQNEGYLYAGDNITINSNATVTNTCRMVSGKEITVNSSTIYNSGLLWASSEKKASELTNNSGTIISLGQGTIKAVKFTNYGTIKGNGFMYLTGKTIGGGTIGVNGYTTDTLKVYTVNRSKTTQVFDDQWGTVYPNVIYAPFAAPDTVSASVYPCYQESSLIILPVEWKDFSVKLSGNTPVLNWLAQYDKGTLFEVQRSYNGKDFTAAARMEQQEHASYRYADDAVSANTPLLVYYRIKAIEPGGRENYSEIKMIRFNATVLNHLAASPNPFTSQVNIRYYASQKGIATIKVFNLGRQLQFVKSINVNKGNNDIAIGETSGWGKGIYIMAVRAEDGSVISAKLIKQ
ncbi:T9SS type A sorting domain-containing protein [Agriterribacter sp.]|uniref:T9SS type A sorting domain-containing protein n=1 Tax=Agriterribacter sp. TaxID=2821509 RepID=UPI002BBF84B9|nr:T9SS type A sorting domain-containing protein [Agriterribacter sp.]HTN05252.1 T9SS type A sorting domain-containing protein [Agriterribacter sp.]